MKWQRIAPLVVARPVVGVWLAKGAHPGWTRDIEFREIPDPITGLVKMQPEETWIPGIDFLAGGLLASLALLALLAIPWTRFIGKGT